MSVNATAPVAAGRLAPVVLACLLAGFAALLVPPFAVDVPPLLDYPNHWARLWLVAGGAETAPLNGIYAVDWSHASTNIGIDLLAAIAGPAMGADLLGPLLLALAVAAPPLGAWALHRTLHPGAHWWPLVFLLPAWNMTLLAGFLNFHIGVGAALLLAAADPRLSRAGPLQAFAGRAAAGALLLTLHMFAFLFYGALLGALALGRDLRPLAGREPFARTALRAIVAGGAALVPLALFLIFAPALPGTERLPDGPFIQWDHLSIRRLASVAVTGFRTYGLAYDAPVVLAVAIPVGWALARGKLRVHGGLFVVAVGLGLLALAMPMRIADTGWMDRRLPLMATLGVLVAVRPDVALGRRAAAAAALLLLAVVVGRTVAVGAVWSMRQADIRSVRQVLAHVPAGAAVLPVEHTPSEARSKQGEPVGRFFAGAQPSYWHYPALAVSERQAFIPTLFTAAGKQPLRVKAPWTELAVPEDGLYSIHYLNAAAPPGRYLRGWRGRYDYVLLLNADMPDELGPTPRVEGLTLVEDAGFARLYSVARPGPPAAP